MKLNGTTKISEAGGDYLVLQDCGQEGLKVVHHNCTASGALKFIMAIRNPYPLAIVRLCDTQDIWKEEFIKRQLEGNVTESIDESEYDETILIGKPWNKNKKWYNEKGQFAPKTVKNDKDRDKDRDDERPMTIPEK